MARGSEVQYIRFYTAGSAARQPEIITPERKKRRPAAQVQQVLVVDPLAIVAIVMAAVLLVMLVSAFVGLQQARQEYNQMHQQLQLLQAENVKLSSRYENSYDLEEVELQALLMGLVPQDAVQHYTLTVEPPAQQEVPGFWVSLTAFFQDFFA